MVADLLYRRPGLAMVVPPGHYSRGDVANCTWRSAASASNLCGGDMPSAVLTASPRHLHGASSTVAHHLGACALGDSRTPNLLLA